jgi:hypothetical protein
MSKKTKNKNNLYVKNINANTITFYLINYINQDNYIFSLSNKLLEVLSTNININIDISSTDDWSFIHNEFHHFDTWFPKRINIINEDL